MTNYVQPGNVIPVTLAANINSGDAMVIGSVVGVATCSGVTGQTVNFSLEGVYELPKASGAVTIGDVLYWDAVANNLTTTSAGNTEAGICFEAAASAASTVKIKLKGR